MSKRSKLLGSYGSFRPHYKFRTKISKIIKFVIIFILVFQFFSVFILSSFIVKTSAMEPGILKGQRVLSAPILSGASLNLFNIKIPGLREPERGNVVIIRPGNSDKLTWYIMLLDPIVRFFTLQKRSLDPNIGQNWNNQLSVKRIIGIPGDTIQMTGHKFLIKPEGYTGFMLEENLVKQEYKIIIPDTISGMKPSFPFSGTISELRLGKNQYFVVNDNRKVSYDSRLYGPVLRNDILGPVFLNF